jgi:hypothetical protein
MKFPEVESSLPNLSKARLESEKIINHLAKGLPNVGQGVSVVANGSLARREVTSQSDFDAYPLFAQGQKDKARTFFVAVKEKSGLKEFSAEGAFGEPVNALTLPKKIGGQGDDNQRFTRRMLLLLESTPIGSREVYDRTIDAVVNRYINDDITDKQIGRFLLNDIIRFYRTMCVDFEFKTVEGSKPWGIRYMKLIYSRKLIYYSGIVMCASLRGRRAQEKRDELIRLVGLPPVDRLLDTMGASVLDALREYDEFLGKLDDRGIREAVTEVKMLRVSHTQEFKEIKAGGHRFSSALVEAFRSTYPTTHPIREAVLV